MERICGKSEKVWKVYGPNVRVLDRTPPDASPNRQWGDCRPRSQRPSEQPGRSSKDVGRSAAEENTRSTGSQTRPEGPLRQKKSTREQLEDGRTTPQIKSRPKQQLQQQQKRRSRQQLEAGRGPPQDESPRRQVQRQKTRTGPIQRIQGIQRKEEKGQLIAWWNCAGGISAKINFIKNFIIAHEPSAFFIFESNIKTDKVNTHLNIKNYTLHLSGSAFARTACYIKIDSGFKIREDKSHKCEIIVIENGVYRMLGVYRPFKVEEGNSLGAQFDDILHFLFQQAGLKEKLVVAGDFNVDYSRIGDRTYRHSKMLEKLEIWSSAMGLSQRVKEITRRRVIQTQEGLKVEESILDHLYTEDEEAFLIDCESGDHLAIGMYIGGVKNPKTKKHTRRDWRFYNQSKVNKTLENNNFINEALSSITCGETDAEVLNEKLKNIHQTLLDELAPLRSIRTRNDTQIINSTIEALKKKRNRMFIKYKKTQDARYLLKSQELTRKLKKDINNTEREIIQKKAKSHDARIFWNTISELRKGKTTREEIQIKMNEEIITDAGTVADRFGEFFTDKVQQLSRLTVPENPNPDQPNVSDMNILPVEVALVSKILKPKKSSGIDGIPMCVIKDTEPYLRGLYVQLFNAAVKKIPKEWKLAKIIPLHKKGNKTDVTNYRPISNLCSISKFFEKILLRRINEDANVDGIHQHGFREKHGTATAVLDLQRIIAEHLDQKQECMIYSVDLSAAFDMLRRDTFIRNARGVVDEDVVPVLYDFLSERRCRIEVGGKLSREFRVDLGCVQGSVLGPKIFNIYTRKIKECLTSNAEIVTYADDSYVIVRADEGNTAGLIKETEECLASHCEYLRNLGMVVNQEKTEALYISRKDQKQLSIKCGTSEVKTKSEIKVLGVLLDERLSWSPHISKTINKMNQLSGALKFIRRRLDEDQFIKVLTSQYYGMCYYGGQAWLGRHTRKMDI